MIIRAKDTNQDKYSSNYILKQQVTTSNTQTDMKQYDLNRPLGIKYNDILANDTQTNRSL